MEPVLYTVRKIAGDYVILESKEGIENTVAMALLPLEICEGDKICYEQFTYRIVKN